jgi:hypothetical protein
MRFFIPAVINSNPNALYERIRTNLEHSSLTNRRIYRIKFEQDGKVQNLAVGDSFRHFGSEPVLAIVEAESGYFVCTPHHGGIDGEPLNIPRHRALDVEAFTASA